MHERQAATKTRGREVQQGIRLKVTKSSGTQGGGEDLWNGGETEKKSKKKKNTRKGWCFYEAEQKIDNETVENVENLRAEK